MFVEREGDRRREEEEVERRHKVGDTLRGARDPVTLNLPCMSQMQGWDTVSRKR